MARLPRLLECPSSRFLTNEYFPSAKDGALTTRVLENEAGDRDEGPIEAQTD